MPSIFKTGLIAAFVALASAQTFSNTTAPSARVVAGWKYDGCVSSSRAGVDFSFPGFTLIETSSTAMTIERCTGVCSAYSFAAITSGSCYCGNSINGTLAVPESSCRNRCPGNPLEACGGTAGVAPVKRQITGFPYYSLYERIAAIPAGTVTNIVITNIYIDICPSCIGGLTTVTACSTATVTGCGCPTQTVPTIPVTTTVVYCAACATPSSVTLTVPAAITPGTVTAGQATVTITGTPVATAPVIVATPATVAPGGAAATTTRPATFTGAASGNSVGGLLALAGVAAALL